ncbi:hypothetical protein [Methylorubrum podarium]|uniref:hypothetical protein n=1 Tax=Methylorubrum podarium TaxID=200476 RepID=UPI001EE1F62B|nr:hypothetical protein [Methylorubrum podarium]GJE68545.1 hypothetical protein CHKEEEPN_0061 [Methylorubrum podarium]
MRVVLQSIDIETVRYVRVPAGSAPRDAAGLRTGTGDAASRIDDIARYRTIASPQALALAAAASAVTTALFWLAF